MARRIFGPLLKLAFWINTVLLLIALLSPSVNPYYFWPPALAGLLMPPFLFANLLFLLMFLFLKQPRYSIIAVVVTLVSLPGMLRFLSFGPGRNVPDEHRNGLKVMSYNVRYFSYFLSKDTLQSVFENISEEQPDVVCFQDYFYSPHQKHRNILDSFRIQQGYQYKYEQIPQQKPRKTHTGLAIFSKFPISGITPLKFPKSLVNGAFYADVHCGKDTVRFFNVHFQSIGLQEEEYSLTALEGTLNEKKQSTLAGSLRKLRNAFRKRSVQVDLVLEAVESSKHPVILCGDFNDMPGSYTYSRFRKLLKDTHIEAGRGWGSTFAGKLPLLRIDYIWAGEGLNAQGNYVRRQRGSDHYPVITQFSLHCRP